MAVPSSILNNARILRAQLTDAEQLVWQILRDRRFSGIKFRRQHPFDRFVLDFYCHEARLALELDGSGHNDQDQKVYDEERTRILEDAGIRVLRFWNHDVLNNLEAVLEKLHAELFTPSPGLRPPSPRRRGNQ
ncbi:MAG: endonuclease domain-containing protein [Desulfuromonadales bacterium]|nr:endonuclease domain-containing protein [Desulfuromonadales bacterium]